MSYRTGRNRRPSQGWQGKMVRTCLTMISGCLLFSSGLVNAQSAVDEAWVELMGVCSTVINDQSDAVMEGFPAAEGLVKMAPGAERAVRHPDAPVIANAVSDGSRWFMCLVAGDPPVAAVENGGLVGAVVGALASGIDQANDHTALLPETFAPVRVTCREQGQLTATFAFPTKGGEFRIVATSELPSSLANPC